ncbi:MAG: hypothetical protein ACPLPS_06190 [bacterium]
MAPPFFPPSPEGKERKMRVRFLKEYEFRKGKKAKAGDIYEVPHAYGWFLIELGIAEEITEKDEKMAD